MGRDTNIRVGMDARQLVGGVGVVRTMAQRYNLALGTMSVASATLDAAGTATTATLRGLDQQGRVVTATLQRFGNQYGLMAHSVANASKTMDARASLAFQHMVGRLGAVGAAARRLELEQTAARALALSRQEVAEEAAGARQRARIERLARQGEVADARAFVRRAQAHARADAQEERRAIRAATQLANRLHLIRGRVGVAGGGNIFGGGVNANLPDGAGHTGLSLPVRVAAGIAIHRGISSFVGELRNGVQDAIKFETKIAEIETITQRAGVSTNQWTQGVRQLSDQFGSSIFDQAEGTYQALSNQVTEGATAFTFMAGANKFAAASVSSTEDAVNLLSSALKGFALQETEVNRVSAVLFKGIELGRFRAKDIANSFGQVAPIAHALGVSLEETTTALAGLTRVGISPEEAITQLTNVMNAFLKPSKAMKEAFAQIGVSSGEAAFQTFGFRGALQKILQLSGGASNELSKLFPNIRGRKGIQVLLDTEQFDKDLQEIKGSLNEFTDAASIVLSNPGKKLEIEMNKVKNFFTVDLGRDLIRKLDTVSKFLGQSYSESVKTAYDVTILLIGGLAGAATSLTLLKTAAALNIPVLTQLAGKINEAAAAARIKPLAALGLVAAEITAFYLIARTTSLAELDALSSAAVERFHQVQEKLAVVQAEAETKARQEFEANLDSKFRGFQLYASAIIAENNRIIDAVTKVDEAASKSFKQALANAISELQTQVSDLKSDLAKAESAIDRSKKRSEARLDKDGNRAFEDDLAAQAGDRDAERLVIVKRIRDLEQEAAKAADPERAIELLEAKAKLLDKLRADARADLKSSAKELEEPTKPQARVRARGRDRSGLRGANDRVKALEREQAYQRELAKYNQKVADAADKEAKAKQVLANIDAERLNSARQLANLEADIQRANAQKQKDAKAALLEKQAQFDQARLLAKEAEAINAKGNKATPEDLAKFDQLIKKLEQNGGIAGLSEEARFRLFQELDEKRVRLAIVTEARIRSNATDVLKTSLIEQLKLIKEAEDKAADIRSKANNAGKAATDSIIAALAKVTPLAEGFIGKLPRGLLNDERQGELDARQALERATGAFNGAQTPENLKALADATEEYISKLATLRRFFLDNPGFFRGINPLVSEGVDFGQKTPRDLRDAVANARAQVDIQLKATAELENIRKKAAEIDAEFLKLPADVRTAAAAVTEALKAGPEAKLDDMLLKFRQIAIELETLRQQTAFGAGGGQGFLPPGQGGPLDFSGNVNTGGSPPPNRNAGTNSTSNFGNINVTVNAAGGSVNPREVARAIQREVRLARV